MTRDTAPAYDKSRLSTEVGALLLSLDAVSARFERLGLMFIDPGRVSAAARNCHNLWAEWGDATPAHEPLRSSAAIVAAIAATLERSRDGVDATTVVTWFRRFVLSHSLSLVAGAWGARSFYYDEHGADTLRRLGLGPQSSHVLTTTMSEFADRYDQIEAIAEEVDQSATSEWDRARYREYQRESALVTPTSFLSGWLLTEAFLAAMGTVMRVLSPDEARLFEAWAVETAGAHTRIPDYRFSLDAVRRVLAAYPPLASDTVPVLWPSRTAFARRAT